MVEPNISKPRIELTNEQYEQLRSNLDEIVNNSEPMTTMEIFYSENYIYEECFPNIMIKLRKQSIRELITEIKNQNNPIFDNPIIQETINQVLNKPTKFLTPNDQSKGVLDYLLLKNQISEDFQGLIDQIEKIVIQ